MADLRYRPRPDALRGLIQTFYRAANPESLCILLAERLAQDPAILGVRVYTLRPGDVCDVCVHREVCETRVPCLHLVANAGTPGSEPEATDRVPPSDPALGGVIRHQEAKSDALSLGGVRFSVPLRVHAEPIGLAAIYSRAPIPPDRLVWILLLLDAASASLQALRSAGAYESWIEELGTQNDLMRRLLGEGLSEAETVAARRQAGLLSDDAPRKARPQPGNGAFYTEAEMRAFEKENTRAVLEQTNGRVYGEGGAAELLGIRPTTLTSRINKMGLKRPAHSPDP